MGPLSGLKVLDLTRLLPGPLCSHFLVRLGASVVKVEQPGGSDYVRYLPPSVRYVFMQVCLSVITVVAL